MEKDTGEKYRPVRRMTEAERIRTVREIFSTVTGKYDFLNHLLSLRRDIQWRRFTVQRMRFFRTQRLLDVATGTADLAVEACRRNPSLQATGVDFVQPMLDAGLKKVLAKGLLTRVHLLLGDALALPFPDASFDVAAIAFGIRNIPDRPGALREMKRVIVPGGQVMVLEMTFPRKRFLDRLYHLYLGRILPVIARIFSRNPAAYHYLADSIMSFPSPEEFSREMEKVGLVCVKKYRLDFGITNLHVGLKEQQGRHS